MDNALDATGVAGPQKRFALSVGLSADSRRRRRRHRRHADDIDGGGRRV